MTLQSTRFYQPDDERVLYDGTRVLYRAQLLRYGQAQRALFVDVGLLAKPQLRLGRY